MQMREIDYILAVAQYRSITNAAVHLGITQPTLSKYLMSFEQRLGIRLFSRRGKLLTLTYAGESYIQMATQIKALTGEFDERLRHITSTQEGKLTIGIGPIRARDALPIVLPIFREKYPYFQVDIRESSTEQQIAGLLGSEVQVALFPAFPSLAECHPELCFEAISNEQFKLCTARDSLLAAQGVWRKGFTYPWVDLRRMGNELFLVSPPNSVTGQGAFQLFRQAGIAPEIMQFSNIEIAVELAAIGFGLCIRTDYFPPNYRRTQNFVNLSVGEEPLSIHLLVAYRRGYYPSDAILDFIGIVKETLGNDLRR